MPLGEALACRRLLRHTRSLPDVVRWPRAVQLQGREPCAAEACKLAGLTCVQLLITDSMGLSASHLQGQGAMEIWRCSRKVAGLIGGAAAMVVAAGRNALKRRPQALFGGPGSSRQVWRGACTLNKPKGQA